MDIETLNRIYPFLLILALWEAIWKGVALWKASQNNQLKWFIFIFIFNTVGILPIIYIKFFQRRRIPLR